MGCGFWVFAVTWQTSRSKRIQVAAIATLGYPLINALGHTLRWRVEGLPHFDAIRAAGHQPVMAFWHGRILTAAFYFRRRGIVVITSENFDGEWIARIIERFGYGTARGSTSGAAVACAPSSGTPRSPFPATVRTVPVCTSTARMRRLSRSARYSARNSGSKAMQ